jgi:glycerate 2-kinase
VTESSDDRRLLVGCFDAAVRKVDPELMIRGRLRVDGRQLIATAVDGVETRLSLDDYDEVRMVGVGKAAASMARGVESVLGDRLDGGVVVTKHGHVAELARVQLLEASHPVPDASCVYAAAELAAECERASRRTLVISVISGGGSALLTAPLQADAGPPLSLADKQAVTAELLACGATIQEMNCVRKHLSAIKGGRMATMLAPATSLNLILSDVVGDRLDTIASGITAADPTTFAEALSILEGYAVIARVPETVVALLEAGRRGEIGETPKPGDPAFATVNNVLLGNGYAAAVAARDAAAAAGLNALIVSTQATGEARELAKLLFAIGQDIVSHGLPISAPACVIVGGETTVTLLGDGKGGRCQELALAFATQSLAGAAGVVQEPRVTLLAAGTDGNDGPTDAAGAFVDSAALQAAAAAGGAQTALTYARRSDAYHYLDQIGALFKPGATNTNVADLYLLLVR